MNKSRNIFARFFGVPVRGQSYLNLLYMLLAFPLGIFYFIFLIGGFTLGIPLLLVLVGVLVLLVVFAGWVAFVAFERQLAIWLLKTDVPPYLPEGNITTGTSGFVGHILANRATWTGLVFLFLKMPLGIFSLALMVSLFGFTLLCLAAPFIYDWVQLEVWLPWGQVWAVENLGEAIILFFAGILMIFVSFHLLNITAWIWGRVAYWMLGVKQKEAARIEPVHETAPEQLEGVEAESPPAETAVAGTGALLEAAQEPELTEQEIDPKDVPLITPPPAQNTMLINEGDLPAVEPVEEKDLSPPEWLLERYDALEYYEADESPSAVQKPEDNEDIEQGSEHQADWEEE